MHLGSFATGRDNNFNVMRLAAALAVIVSHGYALVLGGPQFEPGQSSLGVTPGRIAVDVFFVVSGFLVTRSLDFRRSASEFVAARALRIFPGLAVNALFFVLVVGPLFTVFAPRQYFSDPDTLLYVPRTLQLFSLSYPSAQLPGAGITNGSLWSLPLEVCCYVMLLSAWLLWRRERRWLSAIAVGVGIIASWRYLQTGGIGLAWLFASGALYYVWRDRIQLRRSWAVVAIAVLLLSTFTPRTFQVALLLVGPYLVFAAAYLPGGKIRLFNRLGDYSYGTYIYAFPIQLCVSRILPDASVALHVAVAMLVTVPLAVLSWHVVESPMLKWVSYWRSRPQRGLAAR